MNAWGKTKIDHISPKAQCLFGRQNAAVEETGSERRQRSWYRPLECLLNGTKLYRTKIDTTRHDYFRCETFQGGTQWRILFRCDLDTTTQNDLDIGLVNIGVGFALFKPAEFVIRRILHIFE